MPIRVEIEGRDPMEFEDGTPQSVIDGVVRGSVRTKLIAEANRPTDSPLKAFAREAGLATNLDEGVTNLKRMGTAALKTGASIVGGTVKAMAGAVMPPTAMGKQFLGENYENPLGATVRGMVGGQVENVKRGVKEIRQGDTLRGVGHLAAGVTPIIGPAAGAVGDRLGTPETSEAIGEGAAFLAAPKVINKTARAGAKGIEATGKGASAARTGLTESLPASMGNAMIGATRKYFKFGANPGEALKGIVVNSLDELPAKLDSQVIGPVSNRLEAVLRSPAAQTKVIDLGKVFDAGFRKELARAERNGDAALSAALQQRIQSRWDTAMEQSGGQRNVTPDVANRIKQSLGNDTVWASDSLGKSVNDAMMDTYGALRGQIDTAVPASAFLNRKLSNALTAKKALEAAMENESAARPLMNRFKNFGRAGAAGLALSGNVPAALAALAPEVLGSPAVMSRGAAMLSKMARPEQPLPVTRPTLQLPPVNMPPPPAPYSPYPRGLPQGRQQPQLPPSQMVPNPGELLRDFFDRVGRGGQHLGTTPPMTPELLGAYRRYLLENQRNGR